MRSENLFGMAFGNSSDTEQQLFGANKVMSKSPRFFLRENDGFNSVRRKMLEHASVSFLLG